jgi:hypothetical protein
MNAGVLRAAEFYAGRCVDTGPWEAMLRREGYSASPAAEAVFASYGHLCLRVGFSDRLPSGSADLSFHEADIARACHPDYVEFWEKAIGHRLTPVAAVSVEEVLFVGDDAAVYRSHFHRLYYHGPDFYPALRDSIVRTDQAPELVSFMP